MISHNIQPNCGTRLVVGKSSEIKFIDESYLTDDYIAIFMVDAFKDNLFINQLMMDDMVFAIIPFHINDNVICIDKATYYKFVLDLALALEIFRQLLLETKVSSLKDECYRIMKVDINHHFHTRFSVYDCPNNHFIVF